MATLHSPNKSPPSHALAAEANHPQHGIHIRAIASLMSTLHRGGHIYEILDPHCKLETVTCQSKPFRSVYIIICTKILLVTTTKKKGKKGGYIIKNRIYYEQLQVGMSIHHGVCGGPTISVFSVAKNSCLTFSQRSSSFLRLLIRSSLTG